MSAWHGRNSNYNYLLLHFYYTLILVIQIFYVPEWQHWVATSYMDADLKLYNSRFTGERTPSVEEQLVRIYSPLARDESLVITAVFVQQQSGGTELLLLFMQQ